MALGVLCSITADCCIFVCGTKYAVIVRMCNFAQWDGIFSAPEQKNLHGAVDAKGVARGRSVKKS